MFISTECPFVSLTTGCEVGLEDGLLDFFFKIQPIIDVITTPRKKNTTNETPMVIPTATKVSEEVTGVILAGETAMYV